MKKRKHQDGLFRPLHSIFTLLFLLISISVFASHITWNGSVSSDWSDPNNWDGGLAPLATDDAEIPNLGNSGVYPEVSTFETIRSIDLDENAKLTILASGHLIVDGNDEVTMGIYCSGDFQGDIRINVAGTLEVTNLEKDDDEQIAIYAEDYACPIEVSGLLRIHDITQEYDDDFTAFHLYYDSPLTITETGTVKIEDIHMAYDDGYDLMGIYNYEDSPVTVHGQLIMEDWTGYSSFYGIYQSDEDNGLTVGATGTFEFSKMETEYEYIIGVYQSSDYNPILVEKGGKIEMDDWKADNSSAYLKGFYRDDDEEDFINHGEVLLKNWDSGNDIYGLYNDEGGNFDNSGTFKMTNMVSYDYLLALYMEDDYASIFNRAGALIELSDLESEDDNAEGIYIYYDAELFNAGEIIMKDFIGDDIYGIYLNEHVDFTNSGTLSFQNFKSDDEIYVIYLDDECTMTTSGSITMDNIESNGSYLHGLYLYEYNELTIEEEGILSMTNFKSTDDSYFAGLFIYYYENYIDIYGQFLMDDFETEDSDGEVYGIHFYMYENYFTIHEGGLVSITKFKADYWAVGIYHYYYNYIDINGKLLMDDFKAQDYLSGIYDSDGYWMLDMGPEGEMTMSNFDLTGPDANYLNGFYFDDDMTMNIFGTITMRDFTSAGDVYGFEGGDIGDFKNYSPFSIIIRNLRSTSGEAYGFLFDDGELTNIGNLLIENIHGAGSNSYGIYAEGGDILNQPTGTITIQNISTTAADAYGLYNDDEDSEHVNEGIMRIYNIQGDNAYAIFNNEGSLTNAACAQILTDAAIADPTDGEDILNEAGGLIVEETSDNSQIADNQGDIFNLESGTFTVDAGNAAQGAAPSNWPYLMTSMITPLRADGNGFVPNVLQNTNPAIETYDFFLDENLTESAGNYDPNSNSLTLSGTPGTEFQVYLRITTDPGNANGAGGTCDPLITAIQGTASISATPVTPLPNMGQWALIGFGILIVGFGIYTFGRKDIA